MGVKVPTQSAAAALALPAADRRLVALAAGFGAAANLLVLTGPLFMLLVYDRVLPARSGATLAGLTALMVGLHACHGVLDHARGMLLSRLGARLEARAAGPVLAATLAQARDGAEGPGPAAGSEALGALRAALAAPVAGAVMDLPWVPVFLALLFLFHPALGALALAGGLALVAATFAGRALARAPMAAARAAARAAGATAGETLAAAGFVTAQGMAGALVARFQGGLRQAAAAGLRATDRAGALAAAGRAGRVTLQSLVLALGALLVIRGELDAGAMIAASILLGRALAPVDLVLAGWPVLDRAFAARRELAALPAAPAAVAPAAAGPARPRPEGRLEVARVTVAGSHGPILHDVSLTISPGEVLGVIGASGAGKSTLARLVAGAVEPARGSVRLDGATRAERGAEDWGRALGYLPQEVPLFSGSIAQNIARMAPAPEPEPVVAAAAAAGLDGRIRALPWGYDTPVDPAAGGLSGGERQRLGLARALFGDPVLLVLDEPTAALDAEGTAAFLAAVARHKARGGAAMIVAHRPGALAGCDRLILIADGRIAAEGPRDAVIGAVTANAAAVLRDMGPLA